MRHVLSIGAACLALLLTLGSAETAPPAPSGDEFFEKEVRPILVERCQPCHGGKETKGNLKLTSRAALLKGGDRGPAAVPGKADESEMIRAIRHVDPPRMPPKQKLTDREIDVLTRWVKMGLPWPDAGDTKPPVRGPKFQITDEQRKFWAFQPVKVVPPPEVKDKAWPRSDLDRYILAALEAKELRPAKQADKRTLLRRATFDLTGLPPTPEEVDAFLKDESPDAFAKVVDRLLASPAYGERWGRHWLDLVRYADSFDARGLGGEGDIAHAWRYRDWVADAFNRDLPYSEFVRDQIAGDLVPAKDGFNKAGVIATGFLAIGNWGGGDADKEKLLTDIADDQVDVVSRTFMGLTVACARCHDHKFDPISTADYYGLAGMFFSTHILPDVGPKTNGPPMLQIPLESPEQAAPRKTYQQRLADAEKELKAVTAKHYAEFAKAQQADTAKYLLAAWDYRHPADKQAPPALAEFAKTKGLHAYALRQWLDYLDGGEYRLMTKPVRDVAGFKGVHGWRGEPDCPNLLVNTTDKEVSILTFKLPPKSAAVHPGPKSGVAVAWRSPVSGTVRVSGGVTDADPQGGDGIAWAVDHRGTRGVAELANGDFPNGGAQRFDKGKTPERLRSIKVQTGDRIELLVLPKANHICDTTVVDLTIALDDGSQSWNLAADLVDDPLADGNGNPHGDKHGNAGVWYFLDMADAPRDGGAAPAALSAWKGVAADVAAGKRDRKALEEAALAFQKAFSAPADRNPFYIKRAEDQAALPEAARAELAKRAADLAALKKKPPPPPELANGAQDGGVPGSPHAGVHDVRIHRRGRYDSLGDLVPRRFPEILAGDKQTAITNGSGRLQLAEWLTRSDHPLTARVMVNRIWQYHFGEGIVRTPSNFGKLGERPSHPELLDYLADQFVRSGWSVKAMHRQIMLSATYRQASDADDATRKADPDNRLFGRMNRRRLEAEAIRDNLLSAAGKLDPKRGGPAVRDFNTPRRTLYLMTIRSDRSGFGPLFDSADSTAPVDRRTVSTVAPQALFLLNHPFALEQAKALAKRVQSEAKDDEVRIARAYRLLYARPPSAEETCIGQEFLRRAPKQDRAWEEYCHILVCANEFIYID
jgi:hypothetical protein